MDLLIRNGRLIDPRNGVDGIRDLRIRGGRVDRVGRNLPAAGGQVLDASGLWVLPGLIDVHAHLREPGGEKSETIQSGTAAAAAGGVTALFAMANTAIPTDSPERVRSLLRRIHRRARVRVFPVGAVTLGLSGKKMTRIGALVAAGCAAVSDDGRCVMDEGILLAALRAAKRRGKVLLEHCEDETLSAGGVLRAGPVARRLKVRGIRPEFESRIVARDIAAARRTGAHLHFQHLSTKEAAALVRQAKRRGVRVSAEACPHYFALTAEAVLRHGANAKMKPPLGTEADRRALRRGLADGTIDLIATDHAPHTARAKAKPLAAAPFGVIGLETLFALIHQELILKKVLTPAAAVAKVTAAPARLFKLPLGHLGAGAPADIALFDPQRSWIYRKEEVISKSKNSPFLGRRFDGKIVATLLAGRSVFLDRRWKKEGRAGCFTNG